MKSTENLVLLKENTNAVQFSLGASPMTLMRLSFLALLAAACHSPGVGHVEPIPLDSASAVRLAIAAVADTADTLHYWTVAEYSHTKNGYVIYISPQIKPEYAGLHWDGKHQVPSQLITYDGGGRVYLRNNGTIRLIEVY